MIRSLRLRLTVWYVAFFSVLFLVFSLFLYGVLARSLQARLDQALTSEVEVTAGLLADELEEMQGDVGKGLGGGGLRDAAAGKSRRDLRRAPAMLAASGPVPAPRTGGPGATDTRSECGDLRPRGTR